MDGEYKKFGLEVLNYLDNLFLFGAGGLSLSFLKLIRSKTKSRQLPLDWEGKNWPSYYRNELSLLWIMDREKRKIFLPQAVVIGPWEANALFEELNVELYEPNFQAPYKVEEGLEFYLKKTDFNGENARLKCYDRQKKILIFQGAQYFDWVMTNLSLDFCRAPFSTLREETSEGGVLQDLDGHPLANITGINGLLFSEDGYMIYQKRNKNVLVNPNQLCSGFSGTVDKIDIENLIQKADPKLSKLDTVREAVEEIGIRRSDVKRITFLGITRELIRGGTPEMFYAVDLKLSRKEICDLIPKDREGALNYVNFGRYARSVSKDYNDKLAKSTLWKLMEKIESETRAPLSIPFLTNIALWYWHWANDRVGAGPMSL